MTLKLSFCWQGLVIFTLPMLINIVYAVLPPAGDPTPKRPVTRWVELVEQVSRIAYLLAVTLLVSETPLSARSLWLYLAAFFLLLYYLVWIRYFAGGRQIALLSCPFFLVPMPLAIFPVMYFLCAALWLHNLPALVIMLIFGAAHLTVSVQSFRSSN